MSDEKYMGWANRETWCTVLWLDNEEPLYDRCKELTEHYAGHGEEPGKLAWALEDFVNWLIHEGRHDIKDDIGSLWRVDWWEIAQDFKERGEDHRRWEIDCLLARNGFAPLYSSEWL